MFLDIPHLQITVLSAQAIGHRSSVISYLHLISKAAKSPLSRTAACSYRVYSYRYSHLFFSYCSHFTAVDHLMLHLTLSLTGHSESAF